MSWSQQQTFSFPLVLTLNGLEETLQITKTQR